jgi:hypothetical protein
MPCHGQSVHITEDGEHYIGGSSLVLNSVNQQAIILQKFELTGK